MLARHTSVDRRPSSEKVIVGKMVVLQTYLDSCANTLKAKSLRKKRLKDLKVLVERMVNYQFRVLILNDKTAIISDNFTQIYKSPDSIHRHTLTPVCKHINFDLKSILTTVFDWTHTNRRYHFDHVNNGIRSIQFIRQINYQHRN